MKGGTTLRQAFRQFRETTGRAHPDDHWLYEKPLGGTYLLTWFWEIGRGRQVVDGGMLPIAARDINDWCVLRRIRLAPWEVSAILTLDAKFLEVMRDK